MPLPWNDGMMEYWNNVLKWNVGLKEQYHSNWERSELTCEKCHAQI